MATMEKGSAVELMGMSEREDRIVHARWSVGRAADLLADSDGGAEHPAQDGEEVYEYWGATWRVHLHRAA